MPSAGRARRSSKLALVSSCQTRSPMLRSECSCTSCLLTRESHHASSMPAHDGEKKRFWLSRKQRSWFGRASLFSPGCENAAIITTRFGYNLVVATQSLSRLCFGKRHMHGRQTHEPKPRAGSQLSIVFPLTTVNQQRYTCLVAGLRNCISCYRTAES